MEPGFFLYGGFFLEALMKKVLKMCRDINKVKDISVGICPLPYCRSVSSF